LNINLTRDFAGNILSKEGNTYTYDGMNRLVSGEGETASYDELSNLSVSMPIVRSSALRPASPYNVFYVHRRGRPQPQGAKKSRSGEALRFESCWCVR
jgi:hypothetical protein